MITVELRMVAVDVEEIMLIVEVGKIEVDVNGSVFIKADVVDELGSDWVEMIVELKIVEDE